MAIRGGQNCPDDERHRAGEAWHQCWQQVLLPYKVRRGTSDKIVVRIAQKRAAGRTDANPAGNAQRWPGRPCLAALRA